MASDSCTFIIVPDATSQCKRYNISKSTLYFIGFSGVILLVILGTVLYTIFSEYNIMVMKFEQFEKLKKISLNQKNSIDRYERDIAQLSKHLAQIKQLNNRLTILTGLESVNGEKDFGLGGFEEIESNLKTTNTEDSN
jgi:hypothetical protein